MSVLVCSLLLCSNIHLNPGPVKYLCQVCGKAVKSNQDGIECSTFGSAISEGPGSNTLQPSELNEFRITHRNQPFKLICLLETWLNADVSDDEINLPGYSTVRKDSVGRIGGGVAIHYSDNISVRHRLDLEHGKLELIVIEVQVPKGKSILVSCVYVHSP